MRTLSKPGVAATFACLTLGAFGMSSGTANAASCSSITPEIPYKESGAVVAHAMLNCSGSLPGGWVKSSLIRVRTALPDTKLASNTDYSQNANGNFNAYARGCDGGNYGYKTVADSYLGWTSSSVKVSVAC